MKLLIRFFFLFVLFPSSIIAQANLAQSVNPFIGTGGHGHTFPGALVPFGMVQLSPDTRIDGSWDGCSGYHYSDSIIYGFSHTHLSGTGVSDWGDILITPSNENKGNDSKKYAAKFKHKNEKAYAGYYAVKLDNGIDVELTATERVGIHHYKFTGTKAFLFIDLLHRDKLIGCDLTLLDSVTITGYRKSRGWAKQQYCFFTLKVNKPIKKINFTKCKIYSPEDTEHKETNENAILEFDNTDKKPLLVKVALSNVDNSGSTNNLLAEAKIWDFEAYKNVAEKLWNKQLGKIKIKEANADKNTIFYTSLYHCFIHPSIDMDADKRYRGRDNEIHTANNYRHYNVFSLWDTYRALHPLFTLIEQKRTNDFINTFHHQYIEGKKLPVWELSSNETNCMIGYHSVSVIADAFAKGIKNYDTIALYKAMKDASQTKELGIDKFYKKRFLEINDESESVSKSLEYAYDNWCIAQMGKQFNDKEVPALLKSAQAYKNLFDASTGFMRPRVNGNWYSPFSPTEINNHFTEGNSWHYSFYVPHDIEGLIKLHGNEKNFETKLDELFKTTSKTTGRDQADVTGLIGQYAHGNEPSQHSPFLYHYIGKPQKTWQYVNQILNTFYKNTPDGLIGNDDCGQMSAWYILSALGMYQVCPGNTQFVLFKPLYPEAELVFENGRTLKLEADVNSNSAITSISLNGIQSLNSFLNYNQLIEGGNIQFNSAPMAVANNSFGVKGKPKSALTDFPIIPSPIINYKSKTFSAPMSVSMKQINYPSTKIVYTLNGSSPSKKAMSYTKPIVIANSTQIKVKSYSSSDSSEAVAANLFRINTTQLVKVKSKVNPQYSAEGPQSLVDGVFGDTDWRKGDWLGYQGQDFECAIENKSTKPIKEITANFLQDTRSWILFPKQVNFYISTDGIKYKELKTALNDIAADDYNILISKFSVSLDSPQKIKIIKIIAKNYGTLPEWHDGKGGQAFIFIDEIELN